VVFERAGAGRFRDTSSTNTRRIRPSMPTITLSLASPARAVAHWASRCCAIAGVEADDVIGTLAKQASEAGLRLPDFRPATRTCRNSSGPHITLVNTIRNTRWTARCQAKVEWSEQIVDYLAVVAIASDDHQGVTGRGPKTGAKG